MPHGAFGLDVIVLMGALRDTTHRSVPEIHQQVLIRGVQLAARSLTYLLQRYEDLVALRLADQTRLRERLKVQGQVILALAGLQPDRGPAVLWVIRDGLAGEVLLARSRLSSTHGDLVALVREVKQALPVPVCGIISDGQATIRTAVQAVFPDVPQQLCQFPDLREAAKPSFAADRHAKTTLQKHVRGVRPLERAWVGREDAEAAAIRGYCLAVRSAITDDGRPPLRAPGLRLYDRLDTIVASIDRVRAGKRGLPVALAQLQPVLQRALDATAALWPDLRQAYDWVHQAAHILANHEHHDGAGVQRRSQGRRTTIREAQTTPGWLGTVATHVLKVSAKYAAGLFHCSDVPDLPAPNTDRARRFGRRRDHARRVRGRRVVSGGLVLRGTVRVRAVLSVAGQRRAAEDLRLRDRAAWQQVRQQLAARAETRWAPRRFRHDPSAYLANLEQQLLK